MRWVTLLGLAACTPQRPADSNGAPDTGALPESCETSTWYRDMDRDDHGDPADAVEACEAPEGYVANADDCAPRDRTSWPGAEEHCDGIDHDCDGAVLDGDAIDRLTWFTDADGDGYGGREVAAVACLAPTGAVGNSEDCDDTRVDVSPAAPEVCEDAGVDEDCDGFANDADPQGAAGGMSHWADADGDGLGDDASDPIWTCAPISGYVDNHDDCDDIRADRPTVAFQDGDGDGFGGGLPSRATCVPADGYVFDSTDCDDRDADTWPGAPELDCSSDIDRNCDGSVGAQDADGDGFPACADCDDRTAALSPAVLETCNGVDDDCDRSIDEDAVDGVTWYPDVDHDGYGADAGVETGCTAPPATVAIGGDCDDTSRSVHPGAGEDCRTAGDDDCDGAWNEGGALHCTTFYRDADGDAFGAGVGQCQCAPDDTWASRDSQDCDDSDAAVNPDSTEVPGDGVDQDCDGLDSLVLPLAGIAILGVTGDSAASSLSLAGDQTADGVPDLLVGAPEGEFGLGEAAVISGTTAADLDITGAPARLVADLSGDEAGLAVAGGVDLDDDGWPDLVVGAPGAGGTDGAVYLYSGPTVGSLALSDATTSVLGSPGEALGGVVATAGDVTGEGVGDALIGSPGWDASVGRVLIMDALAAGNLPADEVPTQLRGGVAAEAFGCSVGSAGDLDGDGLADIAVGARDSSLGAWRGGAVYLFGGPATGILPADSADGVLVRAFGNAAAGAAMVVPGDVDGDGRDDLLVGGDGAAWLVTTGLASAGDLSAAATTFTGDSRDGFGVAMTAADLNGDGQIDIVIGADAARGSREDSGLVWVFLEPGAGAFTTGDAALRILGAGVGDGAGAALLSPGNLDGDACDDLVVGAPGSDLGGRDAGIAWLVSGCELW